MESKKFKYLFGQVAVKNGFVFLNGFWHKEYEECIVVLELQKSDFGDFFYLNIKTLIRGLFNKNFEVSGKMKNDPGGIFIRPPERYSRTFDLVYETSEKEKIMEFEILFHELIIPYLDRVKSKQDIIESYKKDKNKFFLLPAIKNALNIAD